VAKSFRCKARLFAPFCLLVLMGACKSSPNVHVPNPPAISLFDSLSLAAGNAIDSIASRVKNLSAISPDVANAVRRAIDQQRSALVSATTAMAERLSTLQALDRFTIKAKEQQQADTRAALAVEVGETVTAAVAAKSAVDAMGTEVQTASVSIQNMTTQVAASAQGLVSARDAELMVEQAVAKVRDELTAENAKALDRVVSDLKASLEKLRAAEEEAKRAETIAEQNWQSAQSALALAQKAIEENARHVAALGGDTTSLSVAVFSDCASISGNSLSKCRDPVPAGSVASSATGLRCKLSQDNTCQGVSLYGQCSDIVEPYLNECERSVVSGRLKPGVGSLGCLIDRNGAGNGVCAPLYTACSDITAKNVPHDCGVNGFKGPVADYLVAAEQRGLQCEANAKGDCLDTNAQLYFSCESISDEEDCGADVSKALIAGFVGSLNCAWNLAAGVCVKSSAAEAIINTQGSVLCGTRDNELGLNTIYVTPSGAGTKDGTSWANATGSIESALRMAELLPENKRSTLKPVTIAVKRGVYSAASGSSLQSIAGDMKADLRHVRLMGGFAGNLPCKNDRPELQLPIQYSTMSGVIGSSSSQHLLHVLAFQFDPAKGPADFLIDGFVVSSGATLDTSDDANSIEKNPDAIGGGLLLIGADKTFKIKNTEFKYNIATAGGALAFVNSAPSIESMRCDLNTAYFSGGCGLVLSSSEGIYEASRDPSFKSDFGVTTFSKGSLFESNAAESRGGALYILASGLNISDSAFDSNKTNGSETDDGGGAIAIDSSFAHAAQIEKTIFSNNEAQNGGAISAISGSVTIGRASSFEKNHARIAASERSYGGAIEMKQLSSLAIDDVFFSENQAPFGGAIANLSGSQARLNNAIFSGNSAGESGGAIYMISRDDVEVPGVLEVQGSSFGTPAHNKLANHLFGASICVEGEKAELTLGLSDVSRFSDAGEGQENRNGTAAVTFPGVYVSNECPAPVYK
jgi:hypothetical protein